MLWNFILYMFYGLSFFTLGVAILSKDTHISELGIARILWLLALFGILHACHEWLELLEQLYPVIKTPGFFLFNLAFVSISFLFLLYFGVLLSVITFLGDDALKKISWPWKLLIFIYVLLLLFLATYLDISSNKDIHNRMLLALPGGLLSGIGLIVYSRSVQDFSHKARNWFIFAGVFMISYGITSGAIPSDAIMPVLGVKIILIRGLSALLVVIFLIKALSVFDIERRELINEQLMRLSQSEKLTSMGILAAGIAHEINNPLTNVSLSVEMLKDMVGDDEKVKMKLAAIERNNTRASLIAKELLHFSRRDTASPEPIDINEIIIISRNLLKNEKLSSIIKLKLQDVPKIMGISWKIEEVFINLLMNSIDACDEEDSIEVRTFLEDDLVKAVVRDTGHGISEKHFFKVFDPFYTTKGVEKGTGLGLAVSHNIIKQHKGDISIDSNEHSGTIVTVSFPVMKNDN